MALSIFHDDYFSKDEIEFFDPKIFLDIKNYFSIPIQIAFDSAMFANPADNETALMTLQIDTTLKAAEITGIGDGNAFSVTPSQQRIEINKENTPDLPMLLKNIYSHLYLNAKLEVDPKYSDPANPVFFNPDSGSVEVSHDNTFTFLGKTARYVVRRNC